MALSARLARPYKGLAQMAREGRFPHVEGKGFNVRKVQAILKGKGPVDNSDEGSARDWDKEFRKWRAKREELAYKESEGLLVERAAVQKELLRREAAFVRECRRLPFVLPPRLHNQEYGTWPDIVDAAVSDCLSSIVDKLSGVGHIATVEKKKEGLVSKRKIYRKKPGPKPQ